MQVFARYAFVAAEAPPKQSALLLEGPWPAEAAAPNRWSLDEAIDARHAWIDERAGEWAERLGRAETAPASGSIAESGEVTFAYLNALALRYYLVRLLRVVAFFRDAPGLAADEPIELFAARGDDEDYVDLLGQLAAERQAEFHVRWQPSPVVASSRARRVRPWRRWAAQADDLFDLTPLAEHGQPRIVICGNPHVLDPVCRVLLDRGCQVWWLYEHFAVRSWWRWRREGVKQLVCDRRASRADRFSDGGAAVGLAVQGVDLGPVVERWLARQAAHLGGRQSRLVAQIDEHFRAVQPTGLLLDEDATPMKRAAVALARQHGARSAVVQHGAPCGPFGFSPLAADCFCAWGASTREQLLRWGVPAERIHLTGWPRFEERLVRWRRRRAGRKASPRILLLATMPPRDGRPDTATFHLTRQTHERMLDMACAAAAKVAGARLVIKLHPRCGDDAAFQQVVTRHPGLQAEVTRSDDLDRLTAESDCVLSCASTSGIEAALMGAPVVQLLPAGSGDVLPAERWGMLGSARDEQELDRLVAQALARGWKSPADVEEVLGNPIRAAVEKVADVILNAGLNGGPAADDCAATGAADR
jgi:hypothetical protein